MRMGAIEAGALVAFAVRCRSFGRIRPLICSSGFPEWLGKSITRSGKFAHRNFGGRGRDPDSIDVRIAARTSRHDDEYGHVGR